MAIVFFVPSGTAFRELKDMHRGKFAAYVCIVVVLGTGRARCDVLYSAIAGATASGSVQPTYSASLNLNENVNNAGPVGFGDDYTAAATGLTGAQINSGAYSNASPNANLVATDSYVKLQSFSYYGDLEPGPNGSVTTLRNGTQLFSQGGDVQIVFFDASGVRDTAAIINGPTATSASGTGTLTPSAVQGPGLHTITSSSGLYIPTSGYVVIEPYLASSYNGAIGASTPRGTVGVSFTSYFGSAPTVGTSSGSSFVTAATDPNNENNGVIYPNSTFANIGGESPDSAGDSFTYTPTPSGTPSSGYYQQFELDGDSLTSAPEPGTLAMFAIGAGWIFVRRRQPHRNPERPESAVQA